MPVMPPLPPGHDPSAQFPARQGWLQKPQCSLFVSKSTHTSPQGVSPLGHAQLPETHDWLPVHAWLHRPQCSLLWSVSTQLWPQMVRPRAHSVVHELREQTRPAAQASVQPPQWSASEVRSTHSPEHRVMPSWHSQ